MWLAEPEPVCCINSITQMVWNQPGHATLHVLWPGGIHPSDPASSENAQSNQHHSLFKLHFDPENKNETLLKSSYNWEWILFWVSCLPFFHLQRVSGFFLFYFKFISKLFLLFGSFLPILLKRNALKNFHPLRWPLFTQQLPISLWLFHLET